MNMEQQTERMARVAALIDHLQAHFAHRGNLVLSESEQYGVCLILDQLKELLTTEDRSR
ncbi:MAG: hypothetical protein OIF57_01305 [Marinobacterium sp.]|nr:hypothetical protein [Marinobacterium sp.]